MKKIKKSLAIILSVIILICILPMSALTASAYSYNGPIANNGLAGINIDITAAPYNNSGWHAYGQPYGPGGCTWFVGARVMQLTGRGTYNTQVGSTWFYSYGYSLGFSTGQTPQAGSVICWSGHVAILEKIEGDTAYISEGGNLSYPGNSYTTIRAVNVNSIPSLNSGFYGYVYFGQYAFNNPNGYLDVVEGGAGTVKVRGWAFDKDDVSQALQIQVNVGKYVGAEFVGEGHVIVANKFRDDVNAVFGVGDYHGFDETINVNVRGAQNVYVHATNIGNGQHVMLGEVSVNIGEKPVIKNRWQTIDGKKYYFNKNGVKVTGWQSISGRRYYFNASGVMKTGWVKIGRYLYNLNSNGVYRGEFKCADKHNKTYVAAKKPTCYTSGNKAHYKCEYCGLYFNTKGDEIAKSSVKLERKCTSKKYVAAKKPTCYVSGLKAHYKCTICGQRYNGAGKEISLASVKIARKCATKKYVPYKKPTCYVAGNKAHYKCTICGQRYNSKGEEITLASVKIARKCATKKYVPAKAAQVNKAGVKAHYKCTICGKRYNAYGKAVTLRSLEVYIPGWKCNSIGWWYQNSDGYCAVGWKQISGKWYYFNSIGYMQTGWIQDGGNWYYLNADGDMATGWVLDGGVWYYMYNNGTMATGWVLDRGVWYWLESSGVWSGHSQPA